MGSPCSQRQTRKSLLLPVMKALISSPELRKQLESTDPPILIDVRLEDDFKAAHIPGAINNCVYEVVFGERLAKSVPERTRPIVV
jgi:rhodanese-related sulfurtransferase